MGEMLMEKKGLSREEIERRKAQDPMKQLFEKIKSMGSIILRDANNTSHEIPLEK